MSTPERHQQIEEIWQRAVDHDRLSRAAFLDQLCGEDATLRSDVESLLAHADRDASFMDTPAIELVARGLAERSALAAGTQI
jgi:hypothetical protein